MIAKFLQILETGYYFMSDKKKDNIQYTEDVLMNKIREGLLEITAYDVKHT